MTYDEARNILIDSIGEGFHVVSAFESNDAFIFTVGEDGEQSDSFNLMSYKLGKNDILPTALDETSIELTRDYLKNANRLV